MRSGVLILSLLILVFVQNPVQSRSILRGKGHRDLSIVAQAIVDNIAPEYLNKFKDIINGVSSQPNERTGIIILNSTPHIIQAAVEKDSFTDSSSYYEVDVLDAEKWERSAHTYKIWIKVNGETFVVQVTKPNEEIAVVVHGNKDIQVYNSIKWSYV